ncbi:S8 family serine peptidase [Flavihumibacter solisilvae]|uniref:Fibronectin type-III domain-containing protein n=1 Tax=Flavihumibacter solisilvae TaxID=1349421 RepID=A0A0C1L2B3_9BACT|nr:S8 family serine peptidase [Flavihumibacter solisilvae]KIC93746.1 hypothetical protein OI18_15360 [Flavihumibacter solisilvae]
MNSPNSFGRVVLNFILLLQLMQLQAQTTNPEPVRFKTAVPLKALQLNPIGSLNAEPLNARSQGESVYLFLRFQRIPGSGQRKALLDRGIRLLEYVPENTYLASVTGYWSIEQLRSVGISATIPLNRSFKRDVEGSPSHTVISAKRATTAHLTTYHLKLSMTDSFQSKAVLTRALKSVQTGWSIRSFVAPQIVEIDLSPQALEILLDEPFVLYSMEVPPLFALNSDSRDIHNSDILQTGSADIPALSGEGVVLGIGDAGTIYHIDHGYNGEGQLYNSDYHATHVAGTLAGKGIRNPVNRGHAYKSPLLVESFNNIIYRTQEYYTQKRMVLTNNSYGTSSSCVPYSGIYSSMCYQADFQLLQYPNLMHVFAAGNSGGLTCGDFPPGYRAINNAYQAAKNVLTVGATSKDGTSNPFSKGPVQDGRIKPEITAIGVGVISTVPGNNYGTNQGTSMSSPQVTGAMALLYERYRQLNNGQDMPGDLIKAVVCNTATDIGNKGVDFANGFGWLNSQRALDLINRRSWFQGNVEQDKEQSFEIILERQVHDFRIMLYWHDQPASFYTYQNLVNDLDITVELPDGRIYEPMVLDTSAAGLLNPAQMGRDRINNIEQVVVENGQPGKYKVKVKGYKVPFGPQAFRVVYHWLEPGLKLLQPTGGELWKPSEKRGITWTDAGRDGDSYEFSYSADNGTNWTAIPGGTSLANRQEWTVPNIYTTEGRIRIKNTGTGEEKISGTFSILPEIAFTVSTPCMERVQVRWPRPASIDSFAVLRYLNGKYNVEAITKDTFALVSGLVRGPDYWFTVQPIKNGVTGERSVARVIKTSTSACAVTGLNGDLAILALPSPVSGRQFTTTQISGQQQVSVQLRNNGAVSFNDSIFLDLFRNGALVGKDTLRRTFTARSQFEWKTKIFQALEPGEEALLTVSVSKKNDNVDSNNTISFLWRNLANPPIAIPYTQNFDQIVDTAYGRLGFWGVKGASEWDINQQTPPVQVTAKKENGIAGLFQSTNVRGQKAEFIGTFNLSAVDPDSILYMDVKTNMGSMVQVAVRGNDSTANWIPLGFTENIPLYLFLMYSRQEAGPGFQVRLQYSNLAPGEENCLLSGISFYRKPADVMLADAVMDKATVTGGDSVVFILTPANNLNETVKDVNVGLSFSDGRTTIHRLDSLAAWDAQEVRLVVSTEGWTEHLNTVKAWVSAPMDDYHGDDSLLLGDIAYSPRVMQFPYLQGFEQGTGGWYASPLLALASQLDSANNPFKPANGKEFWGVRRSISNGEFVETANTHGLVSPVFETEKLDSPHISMSLNRQLCTGMDSVYILVSPDTGRSWLPYFPLNNTTNWYDANGGGYPWIGCVNNGWQVVSTPLPKGWPTVQVMIMTIPVNPGWNEGPRPVSGVLVDDIHIFDYQNPVFEGNVGWQLSGTTLANDWTPLVSGNQIAAAISGNPGQPFGFTVNMLSPGSTFKGNPVLNKSYVFNSSNSSASGTARLYFTHREAMALLRANICDTCHSAITPYDFSVFRYKGKSRTVNGTLADNLAGSDEVWTPESFDLVPYASGYYAEVPVTAYGEFYIGLDRNRGGFEFTATKQTGAEAVYLDWSVSDAAGVAMYYIERAVAADGQPLMFEEIGSQKSENGKAGYRLRDQRIVTGKTYHYRLRIVSFNGDVTFSAIRTISFAAEIRVIAYPNPSLSGQFQLGLENLQGKAVDLRLFDQAGRFVWGRKVDAASQRQELTVPTGGSRLSAGVYLLQIESEGQKKTIRLVVSGN